VISARCRPPISIKVGRRFRSMSGRVAAARGQCALFMVKGFGSGRAPRRVSGGAADAQPPMRLGRPATLNLTHYPGGKIGVVPPRRGCRRAHGRPGRFAPRRRGALRASLTAAPPVGFGTLRSGRRSGPSRPDKEAIVDQGCFRFRQSRPHYGRRASRAIWFFITRRRLGRRAARRRKSEAGRPQR
jgi:hypothetical protein